MKLEDMVNLIVDFLENFVDEDGESKYKKKIDKMVKKGENFALEINKQDLSNYNEDLLRIAENMDNVMNVVVSLYKQTRVMLLRGEIEGAYIQNDTVFLTSEFINNIEDENSSIKEIAKYYKGQIMEINGEQVIATRFWKFVTIVILNYITEMRKM